MVPASASPASGTTVSLDGRPVMTIRKDAGWIAVIGIPLDHDPSQALTATVTRPGATATETVSVEVSAGNYRVQRLNVDRKYVQHPIQNIARWERFAVL